MKFQNTTQKIKSCTSRLSAELHDMRGSVYPPEAKKTFSKTFSTNDLFRIAAMPESSLRRLDLDGIGPKPDRATNNRREYSLEDLAELRQIFAARSDDPLKFIPTRREHEPIQVLSVANFKGGSSKTTTSVHLAHYLALHGYRVLAIDLDPQASLTSIFGIQPEFDLEGNDTAYAALRYDDKRVPLSSVIQKTYFAGIDLVPGNLELMDFEFDTPASLSAGESDELGFFFERLKTAIAQVEQNYDFVIIDTPPSLGYASLSALYAATGVIISVHPAMLDVASCNQFLIMIAELSDVLAEFGAEFEHYFLRFLLTRYNPNDGPQKYMASVMRSLFGEDVMVAEALESTAVAGAAVAKKSLYELESGDVGREALKRALSSMDQVNGEIQDLAESVWGR